MSYAGVESKEENVLDSEEHVEVLNEDNQNSQQISPTILYIKMIVCALFWGGTFVVGKIVTPYASPPLLGFLRFLIASLALFIYLSMKGNIRMLSLKEFLGISILSMTGILAYNLFFFWGLQTIPAAKASLIVANNPLMIALGAAIFLKEKLTPLKTLGIIISIFGASTIISNGNVLEIFTSFSSGDLAIFGCVLSWATYSLVGKVLLKTLSPLEAVAWACAIGTIMFIPFGVDKNIIDTIFDLPMLVWLSVFYLGIFGSALGFVFFYEAVKGLGATKSGVFINFVPVFGVLLSALFLGERISSAMLLGGMFTVCGVYLTNKK